jgi:hypothetical protein
MFTPQLARQMARFQARPELGLCVTHVQNFWVPELQAEAAQFRDHRITRPLPGYVTVTLSARRTLFDTVGQFNPGLGHGDAQDWFLRAAEYEVVMELLPEVLVYRRLHQTNRSRRLAAASRDAHLQFIKSTLDRRRRRGEGG